MRRPIFIGNWKMNKLPDSALSYLDTFATVIEQLDADLGLAAPAPLLPLMSERLTSPAFSAKAPVMLCAQNVHWEETGAHTGEVSHQMLLACGVNAAIIGHSERRNFYGETDETVSRRAASAVRAGLTAVICVGESKAEYEGDKGSEVVTAQLKAALAGIDEGAEENLIVAYEPVWAIGTGLTASPDYAQTMHKQIRKTLAGQYASSTAEKIRVIYGGSVKVDNVAELCAKPDIDGALVGGASLDPETFAELAKQGSAS